MQVSLGKKVHKIKLMWVITLENTSIVKRHCPLVENNLFLEIPEITACFLRSQNLLSFLKEKKILASRSFFTQSHISPGFPSLHSILTPSLLFLLYLTPCRCHSMPLFCLYLCHFYCQYIFLHFTNTKLYPTVFVWWVHARQEEEAPHGASPVN